MLESAAQALLTHLDKPFAFFGHSIGATIVFELARYLRAEHGREPLHLFVSGCGAPQILEAEPPTHKLPEAEFLKELRRLNGTPAEILEHPELMRLITPVLRADFELAETYTYLPGALLEYPITAFGGLEDRQVSRGHLQAWGTQTAAAFSLHMFPGDHFFIHSSRALVLKTLSLKLNRIVRRIAKSNIH